jgi:plasmid stabilization system protein ParE
MCFWKSEELLESHRPIFGQNYRIGKILTGLPGAELLHFPELGRARDEINPCLRSLLESNYLLFCRLEDQEAQVLRILHGSMDLPNQTFEDEI